MRSKHRQANIVKKKERSLLLSRGEERFDAVKLQFRQGEDFMNCYGNCDKRKYQAKISQLSTQYSLKEQRVF